MTATLSRKALNRALLARQFLLEPRSLTGVSPLELIERLAGLQAQQARPPFIGLWSRLRDFRREQLVDLLQSRQVLRATMMRATLHMVSAADYAGFRGALQPALTAAMHSILRDRTANLDLPELFAAARECFASQPLTFAQLRERLANAFPGLDERAMGYAVRLHLPLATAPDPAANPWTFTPDSPFELAPVPDLPPPAANTTQALIRRYLSAFGPASAADFQAWSGIRNAKPLFAAMPDLVLFRDGRRELFDLPGAPRPGEDTPVKPCFIAGFDNLILAYADRSHILPAEHHSRVVTKNLQVLPTFLVDGMVAGTWQTTVTRGVATLTLTPFAALSASVKKQLESEAAQLARFAEPGAKSHAVAFSE